MQISKFKVLLYLKKSSLDKSGKAPIMGRITVNHSMSQFSCKLSCTPELWNPRESRLKGKSGEAVEVNQKIDMLLLRIHSAFDSLVERNQPFDAQAVKDSYQGSLNTQTTLLARLNQHMEELKSRVGVDVASTSLSTYLYTHRSLSAFIHR
ncbi:MAG: Arm DNA-binding domain-containing protein [Mangrovibacterium sp.]